MYASTLNVCIFLFGFLRNDCLGRSRKECTQPCLCVCIFYQCMVVCVCVRLSLFILSFILSAYLPFSLALALTRFQNQHIHTFFITYWFISFPNHVKIYFAVDDFNIVVDDDDDGNNIRTLVCVSARLRLNTIAIPLLHITFIVVCTEFTLLRVFCFYFFFFFVGSVSFTWIIRQLK